MGNYGLFLVGERCPDGAELLHGYYKGQGSAFRYRTDRREPLRLEIENLENPVVVALINSREDAERTAFFSRFGLMSWLPRLPQGPADYLDYQLVVGYQQMFRDQLARAGATDQVEALRSINDSLSELRGTIDLRPAFDLGGEGGAPRMLLNCRDLLQFMTMEIAMVATNGARFAECEHCGDAFLTGHLTWRRSHAKYCSDRCRIAALRARNRANLSPLKPSDRSKRNVREKSIRTETGRGKRRR